MNATCGLVEPMVPASNVPMRRLTNETAATYRCRTLGCVGEPLIAAEVEARVGGFLAALPASFSWRHRLGFGGHAPLHSSGNHFRQVRFRVGFASASTRRLFFNDFNRAQLEVVPRIVPGELLVAHRPGHRLQLQGLRAPAAPHFLNALHGGELHEAGWRKLPGLFAFQRTGERNPLRQKPHR